MGDPTNKQPLVIDQPLGAICWHELFTSDIQGAKEFYAKVVGWTCNACPPGAPSEIAYHGIASDGISLGGLITRPRSSPTQASAYWVAYVNVADVDAAVARVAACGGRVIDAAFDYPSVGRMALVADPCGALIYLYRGTAGNGTIKGARGAAGFFCWHDLETPNAPRCEQFYKSVIEWQTWSMPMGESTYTVWFMPGRDLSDKSAGVGGMTLVDGARSARWIPYITVADVDAAAARARDGGGSIVQAPHDIPGAGRGAVCADPQGAVFGLYGVGK